MSDQPEAAPAGRRGRLLGSGLAVTGALAAVAVVVVATQGSAANPSRAGAEATVNGSVAVQRRNLVETDTESGTLSYTNPSTVYDRLSGTITWLPAVGALIRPGQALFKVDNQPVILLSGSLPAYRDLTPSDGDGPDITELNRDLVALGFDPDGIVVDDVWQAATTQGVDLLQESLGESATGELALGDVVFLPGPQIVASVSGTIGNGSQAAYHPDGASTPEFVSLTTRGTGKGNHSGASTGATPGKGKTGKPGHGSPSVLSQRELLALITLLQAEIAQLKAGRSPSSGSGNSGSGNSGSGNSGSGNSGSGNGGFGGSGGGGAAQEIMDTTSDQLVVTVDLPATSQGEAEVGERVGVEMPDGSTVTGVITAVSSVAQSSSSGNGGDSGNGNGGSGNSSPTVPVTIRLLGHVSRAGLDQASVSVNFAQAKATNVLSVPVTALIATSGTTYAVQEAAPPHRLIPVTLGLFAAGYVQISGPGLYSGLQVTDSQG